MPLNSLARAADDEPAAPVERIAAAAQSSTIQLLPIVAAAYGACLALAGFLLWGTVGINLADEGFLWYGAQRLLQGELPLRDFQAYEPGRYIWCALWMKLFASDGLFALRAAVMIFHALGLAIGLWLVAHGTRSRWAVLFAGPVLLLWMIPRYKFEHTLALTLVGVTFLILRKLAPSSAFVAGFTLGLCGVFGRNHALYGLFSLAIGAGLAFFTHRPRDLRAITGAFIAGTVLGYLPMIALMLFAPGFYQAVVESMQALVHLKGTNLALPVPYPWTVPTAGELWLRDFCIGICFLFLPLLSIYAALMLCVKKRRLVLSEPVFIASAIVSISYAHYAFSRADAMHLSSGIHPFLLGCLTVPFFRHRILRTASAAFLLLFTSVSISQFNPFFVSTKDFAPVRIGKHDFRVDPENRRHIELFQQAAKLAEGGGVFVAPHWPAAYALLRQKSPTWESYFLFSRPEEIQQLEARRLQESGPRVAILRDHPLDGREELRFRNTHPLLWRFIAEHYSAVPLEGLHPEVTVFRAK